MQLSQVVRVRKLQRKHVDDLLVALRVCLGLLDAFVHQESYAILGLQGFHLLGVFGAHSLRILPHQVSVFAVMFVLLCGCEQSLLDLLKLESDLEVFVAVDRCGARRHRRILQLEHGLVHAVIFLFCDNECAGCHHIFLHTLVDIHLSPVNAPLQKHV